MCKWCARQCRPVRHQSSVRAQLRPRSPHVRRQNPDPRHRNAHAARVQGTCARLRGWARAGGRAHASDSAKRACVSGRWAQGVHWARALACRASLFTARPCTQGVRRRASALGDNQGRSERGRVAPFRLLTVACQRSPCSSISQWRRVPLRTILRRTGEELSVYNRPETPSMPGLLRLFRAACDSTSSIDATRSMRVSMYRARAC